MLHTIHYRYLFFLALLIASVGLFINIGSVPIGDGIPHKDKAIHFGIFVGLTGLGLRGFSTRVVLVLVGLSVYGVATELAQGLTSYRSASVADWLFDLLGIAAAYWQWRQPHHNAQCKGQHYAD